MSTILSLFLLLFCSTRPTTADLDAARQSLRPFLDALAKVESGNRDDAVGDHGKAIGRMQIWEVYWQDATDYCQDLGGTYQDCTTKVYAERIVVAYLLRYAGRAVADQDFQTLARIHNGGPKGASRKSTLAYWRKVEAALRG